VKNRFDRVQIPPPSTVLISWYSVGGIKNAGVKDFAAYSAPVERKLRMVCCRNISAPSAGALYAAKSGAYLLLLCC